MTEHTCVRFTIFDEPVSKSRHRMGLRGGRVVTYKDAKTTNAQAAVGERYLAAAGGLPANTELGFTVIMTFFVKRRQRRDVDNFVKLILDGLTPLAWADDSQVTDLHAAVRHGSEEPRTEVILMTNDNLPDWKRRVCDGCGKEFRTYESWSKKRFCNAQCAYAARTRTCKQCGGKYVHTEHHRGRHYCSMDCYNAARGVELGREPAPGEP